MISIWVEPAMIASGEPIMARTPSGTYRTALLEINDGSGARVATIRYSPRRLQGTRSRVWIEIEPSAQVTITDGRLPLPNGDEIDGDIQ